MSSKKSPTIEESSDDSISLDSKPKSADDEKPIRRDSGVVLNSSTYGSATNSFGRNASSGNFLFNSRSGGRGIGMSGLPMSERGGCYPHPSHAQLVDIRRPSIVEMVNSGGIIINQRGSPEINLSNVPVPDVEMMYQSYRRASMDLHSMEDESGRSFQRSSSMGGSSRQLADTAKFTCPSPTQSWWIPKFNSTIIEKHFGKVVIEFIRRRFRIALLFIGLFALLWVVFFSVNIPFNPGQGSQNSEDPSSDLAYNSVQYSPGYVVGAVILFVVVGAFFVLTFTRVYSVTCIALLLSIFLTLVLMVCSFSLALALYFDSEIQGFLTMSFVAQFALTAIIILAIFSLSRMPLIISLALSVVYIIVLELLVGFLAYRSHMKSYPMNVYIHSLIGRVLFYVTLILAGVSTAYLLDIRQHATFWKIAQCVLSQEALELERELKEKTILSMMPKPFADELMKVDVQLTFMLKQKLDLEGEESLDPVFQTLSAPFTICSMDTVTILFADIVDFTKFSSDLSAAELVGILNEVFSTFDDLVTKHNCEKISTLGDCYFCVSGCPEPEPSHADNCVNMGLAIIDALEDIRKRTGHPIRMRVGIHTGSVYCGVMGTKRFKFDVWSKDVRIANRIESIGSPGRVLISSSTKSHLTSTFALEDAEISRKDAELAELQLFYVLGQRRRSQGYGGSGNMVSSWHNQVSAELCDESDAVSEPPASPVRIYPPTTVAEEEGPSPLCPFLKTKRGEINSPRRSLGARDRQASSSIVDIFSKQKQLQKCTSYAELAVPQHHNSGGDVMDRKIVELMEGHNVNFDTYFDPKLKFVTLNFRDGDFEATYRDYGRDLDEGSDGEMTETQLGFRIAKQSYMVDTCTLFVNYLLVMIGSAVCLSSDEAFSLLWTAWLGIFLFGLIVELIILFFVFVIFMPSLFPTGFVNFSQFIIQWFVRSMVGLFMIYYPMAIVLVSISRCQTDVSETVPGLAHVQMAFFVTVVVLMSSITFMGVSHIAKLIGGFLSCVLFMSMLIGVHLELCISSVNATEPVTSVPATTVVPLNSGRELTINSVADYLERYYTRHVAPEVSILLLLVLILLTVVNRMSEISDRLSFISRLEASARRRYTRQKKVQAEWLLFNIIPQHVAHSLRTTGKFSQNHECVGVMFASIVNFSEFLNSHNNDEEVLRLLNQIITEFDTLLDLPQFSNIEKIKTIGSTYMAASGLNLPPDQPCTVQHLTELIDFAQHLIDVLEQVNRHGFVFRMRIGINYGPVTSGVVGSHKMLYDIWGDTVNVASRMDTTGLVNKIHMPEHCLERLAPFVSHEVHKTVNVKGKGEMRTVFVTLGPHHARVRL